MDWKQLAKDLPINGSRRVDCWHDDCRGKKTASITNMGSHHVVHCFKCKASESADPPKMTPAERLAMMRAAEAYQSSPPRLPSDFTPNIPMDGLMWLTEGGLHLEDIAEHGFGWSDKLQRVIMPVYDGNELVATQARSVNGSKPKYIGQIKNGPRPVFKAGLDHGQDALVLTEDILSAARVGKVTPAWALLGTNLMPAVVHRIAELLPNVVYVWMDGDVAGVTARLKMLKQLHAVGVYAVPIITDKDPKHMKLSEIRSLTT